MKRFCNKSTNIRRRLFSLILVAIMITGTVFTPGSASVSEAAETTITNMAYYSAGDGPVITKSDAKEASYGFVMPIFNNGAATFSDVAGDLIVYVKDNGAWTDIDDLKPKYTYNSNWGHWNDGGFTGYWFVLSETTELRLASKSNSSVYLDYTLVFNKLASATITSMTATQGPNITAGITGGSGFTYPTFNGDASIVYSQVADDLAVYVYDAASGDYVNIGGNASTGWVYDNNWGQFTDGPGGYWFTVTETTYVRLQSKSNPNVKLDYTITYTEPVRNTYNLTANGATSFDANTSETGAIGVPLPNIDGSPAIQKELSGFVYQININGTWYDLADYQNSGFSYKANGYSNSSAANQWGYWVDGIYGLWFQPIQVDTEIRIGYPTDGVTGHDVGSNWVYYTFIGNPNAYRPDPIDYGSIELGTVNNTAIEGWNLIWNDEFNGTSLDTSKWDCQIGNGKTAAGNPGWGNDELEYYTNNTKNVNVANGKLNIVALQETVTDPNEGTFGVTSGRIVTHNNGKTNFAFKYGRVDFCVKMPAGAGMWPATWLLPTHPEIYGTWASSGEIDVMEARGRMTNTVCGTIHFGGKWPANHFLGEDFYFEDGESIDTAFHVYSVVWEEGKIKWYVDGKCYNVLTSGQFYSDDAPNNPNAPFDQEFYILMNLAAGGTFDGGVAPSADAYPATMQVEYVRVYQAADYTLGSYTDNSSGIDSSVGGTDVPPSTQPATQPETQPATQPETQPATQPETQPATQPETQPSTQPETQPENSAYGVTQSGSTVNFYVNNAEFADLHYIVNDGGQQNVGMAKNGTSFSYAVNNLNPGDEIKYFFTYKPVNEGALDTQWFTYTVPSSQPATTEGNVSTTANVNFINDSASYYSAIVNKGTTVNLPEAPSKDGALFLGWFTENIGTVSNVDSAVSAKAFDASSKINADTTLYAGWLSVGNVAIDRNDTDSASSANNSGFYLVGAQYREQSSTAPSGLRFVARISDALVSSIESLNSANQNLKPDTTADTDIGYGMVVTTANRLSGTNMLVKDLNATNVASGMKVCPAANTYRRYDNYSLFTAVVIGIPQKSYNTNIAARMYITYMDANGNKQTYYYTETESSHKVGGAYYTNYNAVYSAIN